VRRTIEQLAAQANACGHLSDDQVRLNSAETTRSRLGDLNDPDRVRTNLLRKVSALRMSLTPRVQALAARADQLDSGRDNSLDPHHPGGNEFWEEGARAFRQDVFLEACPWEAGPEQDDWLRGWIATEFITFGRFEDE
jgi:hypothetical protein